MELADEINQLHTEVFRLFTEGKGDEDIVAFIMSKGHERHYAEMVLDNIKEDASDKKNFRRTLFYGIGFLTAGILVTAASRYFATTVGAMFYFFYWGLIVAGISIIARAFIIFRK